jgi:glycosyltransferase domain-containing protein
MLKDVALVIPTYNRPEFVHRTLAYHANSSGLQIVFGDGSDPSNIEENRKIIESFSAGKDVEVIHYIPQIPTFVKPGLAGPYGFIERQVNGAKLTKRKFIVVCGDDDFVSAEFMKEAAEYLTTHSDYSAAMGYIVPFELDRPGAIGSISDIKYPIVKSAPRAEKRAASRIALYEYQPHNALDFAFFRRDTFELIGDTLLALATAAQDPDDLTDPRVTAFTLLYLHNLVTDHIAFALGKVHWLPRLQLGRHMHDQNYGGYVREVLKADLGGSIISPQWPKLVNIYLDAVADILIKTENVDRPTARRIVEGGLALRVGKRMETVGRRRLDKVGVAPEEYENVSEFRKKLRSIKALKSAVQAVRKFMAPRKSATSSEIPQDVHAMVRFLRDYKARS